MIAPGGIDWRAFYRELRQAVGDAAATHSVRLIQFHLKVARRKVHPAPFVCPPEHRAWYQKIRAVQGVAAARRALATAIGKKEEGP